MLFVLKFETDPTLIDVNIHPTKQDIKLSKTNELYDMIMNRDFVVSDKVGSVTDRDIRSDYLKMITNGIKLGSR